MEADAGTHDLIFVDESGFAPTMPTGYTWSRIGQRAVVPREDKSDRHINVLGALVVGTGPDLLWEHTPGKIDAKVLLEFVCCRLAGLPGGAGALALAADGARLAALPAVHGGAGQRLRAPGQGVQGPQRLAGIGVELFYLPPRSHELNDIERVWRSAKYEDYPHRAHTSVDAIAAAVDQALARQRTHIQGSAANFTRTA
ncbi:transposase [Streptomyces afghaniensis]|uniref:transposase n=1 Tax=Streptomyces afghaniensis TaxID=66865 RepID=UPI0037B3254F